MTIYNYDRYLRIKLFPFGGEQKFRNRMLQPIKFRDNEKMLDMCCGIGGLTFSIRENINESNIIIGIDKNKDMIHIAREKNNFKNVNFLVADASKTDLDQNSFNKIFIAHALHQVDREKRLSILYEAKRLLIDGGELIILEEDKIKNPLFNIIAHIWLGNYSPYSVLFEGRTRKEMFSIGIENEMKQVGYTNIKKFTFFKGIMQVIMGNK